MKTDGGGKGEKKHLCVNGNRTNEAKTGSLNQVLPREGTMGSRVYDFRVLLC